MYFKEDRGIHYTSVYRLKCICILYGVQCTLYAVNCMPYIVICMPYIVRYMPYIVCRTLYAVHCTPYIVRRTLYGVHCTYIVRTLYVHCTPYIVRTLYGVHCTSSWTRVVEFVFKSFFFLRNFRRVLLIRHLFLCHINKYIYKISYSRYPVILESFSLRPNTGGKGRYRGGDGVQRRLRFRRPLTLSILTERRVFKPYGLKGHSLSSK